MFTTHSTSYFQGTRENEPEETGKAEFPARGETPESHIGKENADESSYSLFQRRRRENRFSVSVSTIFASLIILSMPVLLLLFSKCEYIFSKTYKNHHLYSYFSCGMFILFGLDTPYSTPLTGHSLSLPTFPRCLFDCCVRN